MTKVQVKAVLFDLFDTLLLVEGGEVWYKPALRKLHKFLVSNGVRVAFEGFSRVYFEVRDGLYAESEKNLEEPHFNVRVSETLKRLGYDFDASDPLVAGATKVFADEFAGYKLRARTSFLNGIPKFCGFSVHPFPDIYDFYLLSGFCIF